MGLERMRGVDEGRSWWSAAVSHSRANSNSDISKLRLDIARCLLSSTDRPVPCSHAACSVTNYTFASMGFHGVIIQLESRFEALPLITA